MRHRTKNDDAFLCGRSKPVDDKPKYRLSLFANYFEIGFRISIPLVLFVVGGVWLDKQIGFGHYSLFTGIALSLITSTYGIKKTIDNLKEKN